MSEQKRVTGSGRRKLHGFWKKWLTAAMVLCLMLAVPAEASELGSQGEMGVVSGVVADAADPVMGIADVTVSANGCSVQTDAEGAYELQLPAGEHTLTFSKEGYIEVTQEIVLRKGNPVTANCLMTRALESNQYRVVLTWGDTPNDLDSHLLGKSSNGVSYHVHWRDKKPAGINNEAQMDVDDISQYGPETVTFNTAANADYVFYVYDFSNGARSTMLRNSSAKVEVYRGSQLLQAFNVPDAVGGYWEVFRIENQAFVPVNQIQQSEPSYEAVAVQETVAPEPEQAQQSILDAPGLAELPIRIELTWGAAPSDLDANLLGKNARGQTYKIYFADKTPAAANGEAQMDVDDRNSYGPETITINTLTESEYVYYVVDYTNGNNSEKLRNSQARVTVYCGDYLLGVFDVPATGSGGCWEVFRIQDRVFKPVNQLMDSVPQRSHEVQTENTSQESAPIRMILTWDENPRDLDAHLQGMSAQGNTYHVYFADKKPSAANGEAQMDVDDRSGYGPETISIRVVNDSSYVYYVQDYENNPAAGLLKDSNARVEVFRGSELIAKFEVPSDGEGDRWDVFRIENQEIIPVNTLSSTMTYGIVSGRVTEAIDPAVGVAGVTVKAGSHSAQTDESGNYVIQVTAGSATLEFSKAGYVAVSKHVIVQAGERIEHNCMMSSNLDDDQYRVVLTWGQNPEDLDAYLRGTSANGAEYLVYWLNRTPRGGTNEAMLDVDDRSQYGPETVTFRVTSDSPYIYYVCAYTNRAGASQLKNSNARAIVYRGNERLATFDVPVEGEGNYWEVFRIENKTFLPVNRIQEHQPR